MAQGMNVLLTGASSFTGYWFARELAADGHHVVAPLRGEESSYQRGVRGERVRRLAEVAAVVWACPFGADGFVEVIDGADWDVFAHHAAYTENYRSADFDIVAALAANTRNLPRVLQSLRARGLRAVVMTGSYFEQDEGLGNAPMRAFSLYGLSKGVTAQVLRYWCEVLGLPLGKFVIPNPFGPYEEPRFCNYLMQSWQRGETPVVRTPRYVRDNIHIDLLALAYCRFLRHVAEDGGFQRVNPSGYPESQGAFALRFAREVGPRLGLAAPVEFAEQTDFAEPLVRINMDVPDVRALGWDEAAAWDRAAEYWRRGDASYLGDAPSKYPGNSTRVPSGS
jgi:UDP-glucose 4-epimerase